MTNHGYQMNLIKQDDLMYIYLHIRLLVNISMYVLTYFSRGETIHAPLRLIIGKHTNLRIYTRSNHGIITHVHRKDSLATVDNVRKHT